MRLDKAIKTLKSRTVIIEIIRSELILRSQCSVLKDMRRVRVIRKNFEGGLLPAVLVIAKVGGGKRYGLSGDV